MSLIDEIAGRLKTAREKAGYEGPAEAARAFGWNEHTYKSHENAARGLRPDVARKYARAFRVDYVWLLTGNSSLSRSPDVVTEVLTVPLFGKAAAGAFRASDWVPRDETEIPAVKRDGIKPDVQYALLVDGPSVNLRIADGMYAICCPLESYPGYPEHGKLVHVQRERGGMIEHTIKEIRYEPGGVALWPASNDPSPECQEVVKMASPEEDATVQIRGVVIGKFEPM